MRLFETNILNCADVNLASITCGREERAPGKSCGPYLRDRYIIHYIEKGTGIFRLRDKEYVVNAGEIFFIPPNVMSYYVADEKDPWVYKWVGFHADNIENFFEELGISESNPVMKVNESISSIIDSIIEASKEENKIKYTAYTYTFFANLADCIGRKDLHKPLAELHVEKAVGYIKRYTYKKITVQEIADYIKVDRSYLTAIFKKHIGMSPQQYIIDAKIKTACEYLKYTNYNITHISQSVGYEDIYVFSHAFSKVVGMSPKEYRKKSIMLQNKN